MGIDSAARIADQATPAARFARVCAGIRCLHDLRAQLADEPDLDVVLDKVLAAAVELSGTDRGCIQIASEDGRRLELAARHGFGAHSAFLQQLSRPDNGLSRDWTQKQDRLVIDDIPSHATLATAPTGEAANTEQVRALLSTPLVTRRGALRGVLSVHFRAPHQPAEQELELLDLLAAGTTEIIEQHRAGSATAQLASIVTSSDDAIISKDLNGRILTWNAASQRLFGYTAEEGIGQSVTLLIPPERLDEEKNILDRIGRGERIEHFETVRRCKGGRLVDVSLTISSIVDDAGNIVGASKIARDITHRRRAERLREQQNKLLELIATGASLEQCMTALCMAVPQITRGTRAAVLVADVERQRFAQSIAPELPASWHDALTDAPLKNRISGTCGEAVTNDVPVSCEDVAKSESWSRGWRQRCVTAGVLATHSTPVRDEAGKPVASFMLGFDQPQVPCAWEQEVADFGSHIASLVISRERSREALREVDRRKDQFLATLAHELRNPLVPLRNGLEIMHGENSKATLEKARSMMDQQLRHLTHLVDDLMDVSRLTRGQVTLRPARVDLARAAVVAADHMHAAAVAAGHTLQISGCDRPIVMAGDPDRLAQVLTTLLDNAVQYTPRGGCIKLALRQDQDSATVTVTDNGMGIPDELLEDIFDIFLQLDPPAGNIKDGLGIGLALARQVVELHGGTIKADSRGPGLGTTVTVRLPLALDSAALPAQTPTADSPGKLRLLVVDDNPGVADALALLLRTWDHEVLVAEDGYQALGALASFQPQAVLLDIGMPGLDGIETAKRMRACPQGEHIMLVAITGWGQPADRERTREAGFDYHLVKPVEPEVLEQTLAVIKT